MAVTKLDFEKTLTTDEQALLAKGEYYSPSKEEQSEAVQQLYDKLNSVIDNLITIGANTTISFGDMVFTTDPKSRKETTSKVTTKTTTLSLT